MRSNRLQSLEAAVKERDEALSAERAKFSKLRDDFLYNIRILEERDRELERYDAAFAGFLFSFTLLHYLILHTKS